MKLNEDQKYLKTKMRDNKLSQKKIDILNEELQFWYSLKTSPYLTLDNAIVSKIEKHEELLKLHIVGTENQERVISKCLDALNETEKDILKQIYQLKNSLRQISLKLHYSERQIKRIHQKAILKLSENLKK